jgi:hypothetical protein
MMQDRTFRGQSPDGTWHEGFLIRSPGVKNSRPGEGWYINSEQEPAYAHLVKPFTIGMNTTLTDGNGAPVFEGDILKDNRCGKDVIFAVRYGEYIDYGVGHIGFYAEFSENRKEFVEHGLASLVLTAKVVGNVVDTPELMGTSTGKEQQHEVD